MHHLKLLLNPISIFKLLLNAINIFTFGRKDIENEDISVTVRGNLKAPIVSTDATNPKVDIGLKDAIRNALREQCTPRSLL